MTDTTTALQAILDLVQHLGLSINLFPRNKVVGSLRVSLPLSETQMLLDAELWQAVRVVCYFGQAHADPEKLHNGHCNISLRPLQPLEPGLIIITATFKQVNDRHQRWDGFVLSESRKALARFSVGFWRLK